MATGRTVQMRFFTFKGTQENIMANNFKKELQEGYSSLAENSEELLKEDMFPYVYDEFNIQTSSNLKGETITSVQIVWKVSTEYFTNKK